MQQTLKKHSYRAFGYNIVSEIPLPELSRSTIQTDEGEVFIQRSDLSNLWLESVYLPKTFITKDDYVLFQIPDTATFLVQDGKRIIISPMADSDEDKIRLFILGTCMSIILMQRKILPLHGSAVAIDGKAYAFIGERGAGKSTLATAFLSRGYELLSDDLIPVSLSEDHTPYVIPSFPQQKLWQESLNCFGMDTADYKPLFERENKYAVPVASHFSSLPLPLSGVFELIESPHVQNINIVAIDKLDRLHTLYSHTFRQFLIPRLRLMEWHFKYTSCFADRILMYRIQRPGAKFTANQLTDLVLSIINKEHT